jgi:integrase
MRQSSRGAGVMHKRSCPLEWCSSRRATSPARARHSAGAGGGCRGGHRPFPVGLGCDTNLIEDARASWLKPFMVLAIETGMRRGELLSVHWSDVDFAKKVVRLRKTKNGFERVVPLTPLAVQVLASLPHKGATVFLLKPYAVRQAWERLKKRASITNLRLHDLRHEAVSRFFEYGLTSPEVALISGHRDPRTLNRYMQLRLENVAEKFAALSQQDELASRLVRLTREL